MYNDVKTHLDTRRPNKIIFNTKDIFPVARGTKKPLRHNGQRRQLGQVLYRMLRDGKQPVEGYHISVYNNSVPKRYMAVRL